MKIKIVDRAGNQVGWITPEEVGDAGIISSKDGERAFVLTGGISLSALRFEETSTCRLSQPLDDEKDRG